MLTIDEPSICTYVLTATTPAACPDAAAPEAGLDAGGAAGGGGAAPKIVERLNVDHLLLE